MYSKMFFYSLVPILTAWALTFVHHYFDLSINVDSWYYFPLVITYSAIGAASLAFAAIKIVSTFD